jgi:hypothetical protein
MRLPAILMLATACALGAAETAVLDAAAAADFRVEITGSSKPTTSTGFVPLPFSVVCWDASSTGAAELVTAPDGTKAVSLRNVAGPQRAVQFYAFEPLKLAGPGTIIITWQSDGGSAQVKAAGAQEAAVELAGPAKDWTETRLEVAPKDGGVGLQIQYFGEPGQRLLIRRITLAQ